MFRIHSAILAVGLLAAACALPAAATEGAGFGVKREGTGIITSEGAGLGVRVALPIKGDEKSWTVANKDGGVITSGDGGTEIITREKFWKMAGGETGLITSEGWHASPGGGAATAPPS